MQFFWEIRICLIQASNGHEVHYSRHECNGFRSDFISITRKWKGKHGFDCFEKCRYNYIRDRHDVHVDKGWLLKYKTHTQYRDNTSTRSIHPPINVWSLTAHQQLVSTMIFILFNNGVSCQVAWSPRRNTGHSESVPVTFTYPWWHVTESRWPWDKVRSNELFLMCQSVGLGTRMPVQTWTWQKIGYPFSQTEPRIKSALISFIHKKLITSRR